MTEQTTATAREQTGAVAGTVKDEAGTVASTAVQAGGEVASTAKDQASQVVGETVRQARDLAGELRQQVSGQAASQTQQLSEKVRSLATELSDMADNSDQKGLGAEIVRQVAERAHGLAGYVEGRQPSDLLEDLRSLARRRPGGFLAGAALAGVLAGRLTRGVKDAASAESDTDYVRTPSSPGYYAAGGEGYQTETYRGTEAYRGSEYPGDYRPAGAGLGDMPGSAGTASGAPTAGVGTPVGTGASAGYVESPYPSTSYRDPIADDGPLHDPAVRPDTSGI